MIDIYKRLYNNIAYDLEARRFAAYALPIEKQDTAWKQFNPSLQFIPVWENFDPNLSTHFFLTWKFKHEFLKLPKKSKPKIYHIPKDFTQALMKVDREIPVDLLPERFFGYFSFAEGAIFDDSDEVQGAYVFIGPAEESTLKPGAVESEKVIWISYVCKDKIKREQGYKAMLGPDRNGVPRLFNFMGISKLLIELKNEKFSKLANQYKTIDFIDGANVQMSEKEVEARNTVFRTLINLVLFVNSIDPDLIEAPTTNHLSNKQLKERRDAGKPINECSVPVTLVSWNYHKPVQYHVDSTFIETFLRWQRCGTRNSQVKLIWVTPHLRRYKKEEEEEV
jgi:hypothetical protein